MNDKKISIKCSPADSKFPIEILNVWDLTELEIIGGSFTYFPTDISILKKLTKLTIVSTHIESLPREIFELPELRYLNLKNNRLNSLPELNQRTKLQELLLGRNNLTSINLAAFFEYHPNLHYIDLGHNQLESFQIPTHAFKKLTRLNIEANLLKDLPSELKYLPMLHHVSAEQNLFSSKTKARIEKELNIKF